MSELRYDNQVVVVTGAGGGLGRQYANFFAARGASIIVNDVGGSFKGEGGGRMMADTVVNEIKARGGKAIADYNNVNQGEKIIQTAIKSFGRIDVLINNAGILRDISFRNMTDTDWDLIMDVHVRGAYKCTRAAWPYFKKQKYGRIINTSSSSGLFGNFGQTNYASAKFALLGFTETLAFEGLKYNIMVNALCPAAGSRMTETVMPPDLLEALNPSYVVPIVAVLVHNTNTSETGGIFEAGGGHFSKLRWERSRGALMRPDDSFTPGVVIKNWDKVIDFSNPEHPTGVSNSMANLEKAIALPRNIEGEKLDFTGKVALITGAGNGLGRAYSHAFAKYGAKVVVNDVANTETVVKEIRDLGGDAVGVKMSVENGAAIVKACIAAYGAIHIVVNNAGILRDKAFTNMTDELWESVQTIHLRGTYNVTKAAWPHMHKQRYGRIVNITSTTGIYGKFGQANYATAKAGILGFGRALAREGVKYNIYVNTLAPSAGTDMTRTVMPEDMIQALKPEYVAPLVVALCSDRCPTPTGGLYESGCGWVAATRWQRTRGVDFSSTKPLTAEDVLKVFPKIVDFDAPGADNPESPAEGSKFVNANVETRSQIANKPLAIGQVNRAYRGYLEKIKKAQAMEGEGSEYKYDDRDVILYNLGIGATKDELPLVYENNDNFQVLPTFGVIPTYSATAPYSLSDIVPNFNMKMLLHGEQYLEILQYPIPTKATLVSKTNLIEVVDKGNAAIVRRGNTTVDAATGRPIFYNESASFIRGSGGFGGPRQPSDRGAATAANNPPKRSPDFIREEKTNEDQAALYRLMGDRNPLHIDPEFSAVGGFKVPILHGLAFFGISGKHVYQKYGPYKNIKVRFAGTVLPGETLVTEMWKEDGKVIYQVRVKDTGKLCITNAAVELMSGGKPNL